MQDSIAPGSQAGHDTDAQARHTDGGPLDREVTRRGALALGVGAAATVATAGMSGTVAASNTAINWDSDLAPQLDVDGLEVEVAEHQSGMGPVDFVADDDSTASLREHGWVVAAPEESDNDDLEHDPHNPISIRADRIDSDSFAAWPRGVEDSDGDAVSALDSDHWDGALVAGDTGDALDLSGSGGDSATLDLSDIEAVVDSGVERSLLFVVASADQLDADGLDLHLIDSSGTSVTTRILDEAEHGAVSQVTVGNLDGSSELADISEVEVEAVAGDVDATVDGLDLERSSPVGFGEREVLEAGGDDDVDAVETETIEEPSGWFDIRSLDSIELAYESISDVNVDVELDPSQLPAEQVRVEFIDAGAVSITERRMRLAVGIRLPTAFDLAWSLDDVLIEDTAAFAEQQYETVEAAQDHSVEDMSDPADMPDDSTDLTSDYEVAAGDEVDITTALGLAPGVESVISFDVFVADDQEGELTDTGGLLGVGGGGSGDDDGIVGTFRGFVLAVAGIGGTVLAYLRSKGHRLIGGS